MHVIDYHHNSQVATIAASKVEMPPIHSHMRTVNNKMFVLTLKLHRVAILLTTFQITELDASDICTQIAVI